MQCWRSSAVQSEAWLPVLLQTAQSTICCHGSAVWRWLKHCWRYPAIFRNQLTSTTYLSNDPKRSSVGATHQIQKYNTQTDQTANIETNQKFDWQTPATQIDEFVPEPAPLNAAETASWRKPSAPSPTTWRSSPGNTSPDSWLMTSTLCTCNVHTSCHDNMGVSENSVPLNPMVNDHYPYNKWLFHWEYTLFSDKPISCNCYKLHQVTHCYRIWSTQIAGSIWQSPIGIKKYDDNGYGRELGTSWQVCPFHGKEGPRRQVPRMRIGSNWRIWSTKQTQTWISQMSVKDINVI